VGDQKVIGSPRSRPIRELPPLLQGFGRWRRSSGHQLALGDRFCRLVLGHGDFIECDVSDPSIEEGQLLQAGQDRQPRCSPSADQPLNGGPQMVEISRDGNGCKLGNGLYTP
jgi:selenium-binding protein 1